MGAPIHVEYQAPPGCSSAADFIAGVEGRTPLAAGRTFSVTVTPGATGRLVVDGVAREVEGDSCDEVVSALSLMAALSVDPNAAMTLALPTPTESTPVTVVLPTPNETRPAPARKSRWHFGANAGVSVVTGVAPRAEVGVPFGVDLVGPASFHLAFERTDSSGSVAGAVAAFTWTVGIAEGCPHRWRVGPVDLEPCLRFEGGQVKAEASEIVPARSDSRAWLAVGATGRAEWSFWAPFYVGAEAGIRAPITRTTYFFEPDTTVYRAPIVGALAAVGVGARFP